MLGFIALIASWVRSPKEPTRVDSHSQLGKSSNFGKQLGQEKYRKKRVLVYTRDNFTPKPAVATLVKTVYLYPSGSMNQREKNIFLGWMPGTHP